MKIPLDDMSKRTDNTLSEAIPPLALNSRLAALRCEQKAKMKTQTYNGWKNRQTWNVALYFGNDEGLYRAAVDFMRRYKGRAPYRHFIESNGMENDRTPDNISYTGNKALNKMMWELA